MLFRSDLAAIKEMMMLVVWLKKMEPTCWVWLKEHIEQLAIMIDEGLPVFGYCPWSFVDVVSSHQGFAKRYGLVYVDRTETDPKQCARVKKDSFYWYQKVITNNGLTE